MSACSIGGAREGDGVVDTGGKRGGHWAEVDRVDDLGLITVAGTGGGLRCVLVASC